MTEVFRTGEFIRWLGGLRDSLARKRITLRIGRLRYGLLGDTKSVGAGVLELRVDCGPGYRLYCLKQGDALIVLLCGGDKKTQQRDIERANSIAEDIDANGMEDGTWL